MIPIQNIYYMLSYAFQVLKEQGYKDIAAEKFDNAAELCAAILIKGISIQLKRGLGREYIPETDTLSALRGKIDIFKSIKACTMLKRQMVCTYDIFSINCHLNRILKAAMELLLRADISPARKKQLRKLLILFKDIDAADIHKIDWNVHYNRNNQTYRMLISVCWLVVKGLLQTNSEGTLKMMDFIDEQRMSRLYEKFILEYYRKEHPEISANASQIPWQLDDGIGDPLDYCYSFYEHNLVFLASAPLVYQQFASAKYKSIYFHYSWTMFFININSNIFKHKKHLFMCHNP